jgi:charged multivesicular body protein 1
MSKKCEKEEKAEKDKIRKALEKDNHDGARIYAQNAIRQKNQALNYLRLSSRVDAVSSRLESAMKMQQVTKSMGSVVKGMDKVLGSMNIEQISKVMDQFEQSFEDMDVRSEYIEGAMNASTTAVMPEGQVDELMQMVADQHGLKMQDKFGAAVPGAVQAGAGASGDAQPVAAAAGVGGGGAGGGGGGGSPEDDLEERLRKLRSG